MDQKLTTGMLRDAYKMGAFPMTRNDGVIEFYGSSPRAIFEFDEFDVSRSLRKKLNRTSELPSSDYVVTYDQCFENVMRSCVRQKENWISEPLIEVFTACHREGWGHSCEVWYRNELAGGVYGLALGACFFAESMFHRERDCSKIALWALMRKCRELGFTLFDAQIMNPHLASLGAKTISLREYSKRLKDALTGTTEWSR